MPGFVKGNINLRGKVIPLVDMRSRFQLQAIDYNDKTCVIIIESTGLPVGLIVEAVSEVMKIVKDQIESSPKVGQNITSRFVDKIGKVGEEIKIILNLDKLLNEEEKAAVEDIGRSSDSPKDSEKKSKEKEQAKELAPTS